MSTSSFSTAHRIYVKSLYKRFLVNSLNWTVRRDLWRPRALAIRAEFERNRDVHDPRALVALFEKAEAELAATAHPDPYIPALYPGGTKWYVELAKVWEVRTDGKNVAWKGNATSRPQWDPSLIIINQTRQTWKEHLNHNIDRHLDKDQNQDNGTRQWNKCLP